VKSEAGAADNSSAEKKRGAHAATKVIAQRVCECRRCMCIAAKTELEEYSMKKIYLVRHCKAGGQDPSAELTDEGIEQAELLSDFFSDKGIEVIISSPYTRAVSTIRPLSDKRMIKIQIDHRLSERVLSSEDLPDWMERLNDTFSDLDLKLTGGESSREAMIRGAAVITELFHRPENNFIVVTHGNLMTLMLKHYDHRFGFGEWKSLTNPDVYELCKSDSADHIEIRRLWK